MFVNTKKHILPSREKDIIIEGDWLTDIHMDYFGYLLQNCSDYRPVETWRVQCLDRIQPIPVDKKHIQILHSSSGPYDGHWVCSYYNKKNIFIYDSLNSKNLHKHHEQFLKRLFPTYDFEKYPVKFPTVQHQPNGNDCGVFAIAFAISLLFNIKPEKVKYDHNLMRSHLMKIFESNVIEHFPQDLRYGAPQKILSLTVVKAREAEAIRVSTIRQHETKQQKLNRLKKVYNSRSKKKLSNNQLLILTDKNTQKEFIQITNNIEEINNIKETSDTEETNNIEEFTKTSNNIEETTNIEEFIQTNYIEKTNDIEEIDKYFQNKHYIKNHTSYKIIDYNSNDLCSNNKTNKIKIYEQTYTNKNSESKCTKKRSRCEDTVQLEVINKKEQGVQDLESLLINKQIHCTKDLENNRAKKRHRCEQDLENNRANRYQRNLEDRRAKKRNRYKQNIEHNRAKERYRYNKDIENKRAKKRDLYKQNIVKQRAQKRKRYSINTQQERDRQKELDPDRKWLYNRRYYQKSKKSVLAIKNHDVGKKIIKKYEKFWSKNTIKLRHSLETFIKNIVNKLSIKGYIGKRLKAEKIVRWCMHVRRNHIRNIYKMLALIKKKTEASLTQITKCSTIEEKLDALCGESSHTASSENYFIDSTYRHVNSKETLVMNAEEKVANLPLIKTALEPLAMNAEGQVVNILPLIEIEAKKSWSCNTSCKTDDPFLINRYQKFLETINTCILKNVPKLIENIHKCTMKISNEKLGHTRSCHIDFTLCEGMFLPIQLLSPHFPRVRYIKRLIYQLTDFYRKMNNLDEALTHADLNTLNEIITSAEEKADMYKHQQADIILSDDDIISKYHQAFKALVKRSTDTPRHACVSCEKLCYKRNVSEVNILREQINIQSWRDLMTHIQQENNAQYICTYCAGKFRKGLMPAYCILNNLLTNDVPEVISSLNTFEKMIIQRAKAFQTVVKMGTVMNKKLPQRQMVQKVKGRTFHLPLPLQETLNKLCLNTDPININNELYILVRGIPTKSKIIWEEMVDVKKIFDALTWLKRNNALYYQIILPNDHNKLNILEQLKNSEFQMEETEATLGDESDNESLNNLVEKTKNDVEITLDDQQKAMLTQVTDENDGYYEQYTIYPLYEKKANKTSTDLYQMIKIQNAPLDNREKDIDLMCFPDLYPFGINGQHEIREVKLRDHEFIKCRLTSKHPQYRLNQQYLFYLLNNANMRQLNRGIYHKLNVTNSQVRYTASEYLEAMSKEQL